MPKRKRHPDGFSLVELLVVIAIIGILIALLLPAVQQAREAARRTQCQNNIKQIVLAMHGYHDSHERFPINFDGVFAGYDENTPGHSWMVRVLPYIEQKNLYEIVEFGQPARTPNNLKVAQTVVPTYLCPSDTHDGRMGDRANTTDGKPRAVTNYKGCNGTVWVPDVGRWTCGAGLEDALKMRGIVNGIYGNWLAIGIHDVTDGTTNTFAVGEAVPAWSYTTWWYWFNGSTATACIPFNAPPPAGSASWDGTDASGERLNAQWWDNYGYMSRHEGGGFFGMADGSVRFVNEFMDREAYRSFGTIGNGEVGGF